MAAPNPSRRLRDLPVWRKFGPDVLAEKRRNAAMWELGFLMRAIDPGTLMFPSFGLCHVEDVLIEELRERRMPCAVGVDLSGAKRKGNAISVVGIDPRTRKRVLVDHRRGNWKSPDVVKELDLVCADNDVHFVMVENNGYQQAIIDWIQETRDEHPWWMKVKPFTTGNQVNHPEIGLHGFELEFNNRGWVFPARQWMGHPGNCECAWCLLKREIATYPSSPTKDSLMSLWFAKSAIDHWMVWAMSPEQHDLGNFRTR